ncbi:MAG TPA: MBL fold metallo-hydrolase [Polyangiales bacterium]|nr:MBL fold metallo-hydrolase [Polyangiales bacterium]
MRAWLRNAAAVLALLIGFLGWSLMPSKLHVRAAGKFDVPHAEPPEGMSIAALVSGETHARAIFAYRGGGWSDVRSFPMGGILVRHPGGSLLFDAGFGSRIDEHVAGMNFFTRSLATYSKGEPVAAQLKAAGIAPQSLKAVVLTHAHWDHVSGLEDFRGVPVWLPAAELEFIKTGGDATELARRLGKLNYVSYDFPDGAYLGFTRSRDVFGDGSVVIVPAPGHTPGSVITFLTLPGNIRYALVGDLIWQKEGIDLPAERPWPMRLLVDEDPTQVRELILQMQQITRRFPSMVIVPAHDARVWSGLPKL